MPENTEYTIAELVEKAGVHSPKQLLGTLVNTIKSARNPDHETAKKLLVKVLPLFAQLERDAPDNRPPCNLAGYLLTIAQRMPALVTEQLLTTVIEQQKVLGSALAAVAKYVPEAVTEPLLLKVAELEICGIGMELAHIAKHVPNVVTEAVALKTVKNMSCYDYAQFFFVPVARYAPHAMTEAVLLEASKEAKATGDNNDYLAVLLPKIATYAPHAVTSTVYQACGRTPLAVKRRLNAARRVQREQRNAVSGIQRLAGVLNLGAA